MLCRALALDWSHEHGDDKQATAFYRIIVVTKHGNTYELDIKHVEIIIRDLDLKDPEPLISPWVEEAHEDDEFLRHERF